MSTQKKRSKSDALASGSVSATTAASAAGNMLSRRQAAARLDVSDTTYRRIERTLQPVVDARGVHRIAAEQIEELRVRRGRVKTAETPGSYTGEISAAVLELLDEGHTPREILKRLQVHPLTMKAILNDAISLHGGFFVDGDQALRLERHFASEGGDFPIKSFEMLDAHILGLCKPQCGWCRKRPPRICLACGCRLTTQELTAAQAEAHLVALQASNERLARAERQEEMLRRVRPPRGGTEPGATTSKDPDERADTARKTP